MGTTSSGGKIMALIKLCRHRDYSEYCEEEFDAHSACKRRVGGYIDECPSCVEGLGTERTVKYRGVISGDGKMAALSIVKFGSDADADAYVRSFNSCGSFGGRKTNSCNSIKHEHVGTNMGNSNHKGKSSGDDAISIRQQRDPNRYRRDY